MHQDSRAVAILVAPHTQQLAILDISLHLSCVAAPIKRVPAKYLGLVIALAVLFGAFTPAVARSIAVCVAVEFQLVVGLALEPLEQSPVTLLKFAIGW
jgi:hypothetical protein